MMKRFFIFTVFLAIFSAHLTLAAEEEFGPQKPEPLQSESIQSEPPRLGPPIVRTHIPTLVEAVRFSGDVRLCGEKIPFTDPEVRERLEKEMMLAVWNRPQVMLWLKRAHRWFPHIESVLKQENLPLDLKYLPIVESALLAHG
ncbi:MAG: lytic transglycosylase, partial [Desulfobacter sp.]|nr:lytic transglycosylase [Desulfobacter sp.]